MHDQVQINQAGVFWFYCYLSEKEGRGAEENNNAILKLMLYMSVSTTGDVSYFDNEKGENVRQ